MCFDIATKRYLKLGKRDIIFFDGGNALLSYLWEQQSNSTPGVKSLLLTQIEMTRKGKDYDKANNLFIIIASNFPDRFDDGIQQQFSHKIFLRLPGRSEHYQASQVVFNGPQQKTLKADHFKRLREQEG